MAPSPGSLPLGTESMATRYAILSPISLTKGSTPAGSRSKTLTPMNVASGCFFWSSVRWGMDVLHGPHQVAQNSTT